VEAKITRDTLNAFTVLIADICNAATTTGSTTALGKNFKIILDNILKLWDTEKDMRKKTENDVPNAVTRKAIEELESGKGKKYSSVKDLMVELRKN